MSDEMTRTQQWIYEKLSGSTPITGLCDHRFYSPAAPLSAAHPFVVFDSVYALDVATGAGHDRIMVDSLWRIRGVLDSASYSDDLQTIADAIDTLFDRSDGGTAGGATIFTSVREEPFMGFTTDEGVEYRQLGGLYRIWTQRP